MENTGATPESHPGIENLREPWKPGECGNPNGRPKGVRNRQTIVREILEALHESGRPNVEVATASVVNKALAGDVTAWEKLMDSGYGKVVDKSEVDMNASINEIKRTIVDAKAE